MSVTVNADLRPIPAREWSDDHGQPLGTWIPVSPQEWTALVQSAGGLEGLSVFASLTDLTGFYGEPQTYTAWGVAGEDVPIVDIRDLKDDTTRTVAREVRAFVRAA